jgi:hypothetical protein
MIDKTRYKKFIYFQEIHNLKVQTFHDFFFHIKYAFLYLKS